MFLELIEPQAVHFTIGNVAWHRSTYSEKFICTKPIPHLHSTSSEAFNPRLSWNSCTMWHKKWACGLTILGNVLYWLLWRNEKGDSRHWNRCVHYTCHQSFPHLYVALHGTWTSFSAHTLYSSLRLIFQACSIIWTSSLSPHCQKKKRQTPISPSTPYCDSRQKWSPLNLRQFLAMLIICAAPAIFFFFLCVCVCKCCYSKTTWQLSNVRVQAQLARLVWTVQSSFLTFIFCRRKLVSDWLYITCNCLETFKVLSWLDGSGLLQALIAFVQQLRSHCAADKSLHWSSKSNLNWLKWQKFCSALTI